MKANLEIVKFNLNDVVTASNPAPACPYEACPGLEDDPYAMEG